MNLSKIDVGTSYQTVTGPDGIELHLDAGEIFPNDPGQGTPAIVKLSTGDTATFNCVDNTLEVSGIDLTSTQQNWIRSLSSTVDDWLNFWTLKDE
jgi:hypothetical protein